MPPETYQRTAAGSLDGLEATPGNMFSDSVRGN